MITVYKVIRHEDESGVSGEGHVADVVEFENGKAVMCWRTEPTSVGVYDSLEELEEIHGHDGKTELEKDMEIWRIDSDGN